MGGGARIVSRFAKDIAPNSLLAVGTERSQGASFISGYPQFSFDDDDMGGGDDEGYSSWKRKKSFTQKREHDDDAPYSSKKSVSLDQIRNLLMPADEMKKEPVTLQEYFGKPSAALEQLAEGVEVIHPTFGKGHVVTVSGGGSGASVVVKFESFEDTKKLVYRFAKLVLA